MDFLFNGFEDPKENWSKLPHSFIESMSSVETIGEMKVILYILRHTWGFQDVEKRITLDEFENGRKKKDGTRLDKGTGLSIPTISDGLRRAEEHGFIQIDTDNRDRGRVKKYYSLRMNGEGERNFTPDNKHLSIPLQETLPRSEKETIEINDQKEICADAYTETDSVKVSAEQPILFEDQLKPTSPASIFMFELLNQEAMARKRHGAVRFPSASAKASLEASESDLGVDYAKELISKFIKKTGHVAVYKVIAYLEKCEGADPDRVKREYPEYWKAIVEALRVRPDLSNGHSRKAAAICQKAIDGGYSASLIRETGKKWWSEDWRGKKEQEPTTDQFLQALEIRRKSREENDKRWATV